MKFSIDNKEKVTVNKCIRFPKELVEEIKRVTNKKRITFSRFVILACKYALENMDDKK